jgi:type III pantothenate kinase
MRSGIMLGAACMLDGMVERMEAELGQKTTVVVTGGIAKFVVPMCRTPMVYDKDLLLKGLAILYRENVKN